MKTLHILVLSFSLNGLTACGDYAYGPSAPQEAQVKHWGTVGNNQPVSVGPDRKTIMNYSGIHQAFVQVGYDKDQIVDDYMNCMAQADSSDSNPALGSGYKSLSCLINKGYDTAILTPQQTQNASYGGYCGFEPFRNKNLAFCRSISYYPGWVKNSLTKYSEQKREPHMDIWTSRQPYESKILDNLDCMEIAYATSATTNLYPFYKTWGNCMDKRGYELVDNVEDYENYSGFCGWKPYFLKHTEFCLSNQDNYFYKENMKLFKDYYELHGQPNPNETTRPGDQNIKIEKSE